MATAEIKTARQTSRSTDSRSVDNPDIRAASATLLRMHLNEHELKLNAIWVTKVETAFLDWLQSQQKEISAQLSDVPKAARERWLDERLGSDDRRIPANQAARHLATFLMRFIDRILGDFKTLKTDNQKFRTTFASARTLLEKQQVVLMYASTLGASDSELRADRTAFGRWFDEEAVTDRYLKKLGESEFLLAFVFERAGHLVNYLLQTSMRLHSQGQHNPTAQTQPPSLREGRSSAGSSPGQTNDAAQPPSLREGRSSAPGRAPGRAPERATQQPPTQNTPQQLAQKIHAIWNRVNLGSRVQAALRYEGDDRLYVSVIKGLRLAIMAIPEFVAKDILSTEMLMFLHRTALEGTSDVWLQCEALETLSRVSFEHARPFLQMRLTDTGKTDDMFVRRHVLNIFERHLLETTQRNVDWVSDVKEASPFVRQKLAKVAFLSDCPETREQWKSLVLSDEISQVRAAALLAPLECTLQPEFYSTDHPLRLNDALQVIVQSLRSEADTFVQRTAMHVCIHLLKHIVSEQSGLAAEVVDYFRTFFSGDVSTVIRAIETNHEEVSVRRWAAQAAEQIWALTHSDVNELIHKLKPRLYELPIGRTARFPKAWFKGLSDETMGRMFAVISQDDFGYDVRRGWSTVKVTRGPVFGFRLWRFFFEFSNMATDKRQGLSHTVGRISTATMRAPSQILGELSETKVPGEPFTIGSEGGWRPFLPLLDDVISTLNLSWFWAKTVRFYSSQGITSLTGPRGIFKQFRAAWRLSFRFKKHADLRNWDESSFPASRYVESLREMGFRVEFQRHEPVPVSDIPNNPEPENSDTDTDDSDPQSGPQTGDSSVQKFFIATALAIPFLKPLQPLLGENGLWTQVMRFADYFSSAFENTLEELVVFAGLFFVFFCVKHFWANYSFRKARKKIPLSVGGWGTRGKSGTERLKAALFGVLGHGIVSKTTGCEAMFIQGHAYGDPIEIPLFRPYDKATIWEQRDLIKLSAKLEPSVFLWECMALNPSFVDLLQRQWMQDDLATITNTYPDHEDVQGPAGHNVAQTICCFVPLKSVCMTTEQVMRPYVTEKCRLAETEFRGVGWLESGLITDDVLERFPYQEHPDNIALVATMASYLGVEYEYSLKAMADLLVPDLGVLKTHPISCVRHRNIEFTNGCSANERFGCMGNWKRLGFDQQDPWEEPTTWISGVVNNRADRVPRSKVFAKIIVEDVNADRFFLIGNNLLGLKGFIEEAWQDYEKDLSLRDRNGVWETAEAVEAFKQHAWNSRQPTTQEQIQRKVAAMVTAVAGEDHGIDDATFLSADSLKGKLESADVSPDLVQSMVGHLEGWTAALGEFEAMKAKVESGSSSNAESLEVELRALMKVWYFRKLVIVENYFSTGEEVVGTVVDHTPPGFTNRVMGLQNIKGTGLDFVYRFQAWDMCYEACDAVKSKQAVVAEKGLQVLLSMPVIGQLCQARVRETIAYCRGTKSLSPFVSLVDQIEQKLDSQTQATGDPDSDSAKEKKESNEMLGRLHAWSMDAAEQLLDVNDSVRRRVKADKIYKDLGALRISRQRAIAELRKINKRQKGGWLKGGKK